MTQHHPLHLSGGSGGVEDRGGVGLIHSGEARGDGYVAFEHREELRRIEDDGGDVSRELRGGVRGGEGDGGLTQFDLVSQLGGGGEGVGGGDGDA